MKVEKGTFNDERLELYAPVVKGHKGIYTAVLSDDSIDRDGEIVGKEAMQKIMSDDTFLAGLIDHENKILNMVCQWVNKRLETINGHTTLLAEPKFFEANKKAKEIQGMLDEGAKMGISIGAIVKDKEEREVLGKTRTVFTDLELVEASFVAIPSNRHAHALAVAKSYQKNKEVTKMTEEEKAPVEEVVEEPVQEEASTEEAEEKSNSEIVELSKQFTEFKETATKAEKEYKESLEKVNSKLEATEKELKDLKEMPLNKATQEFQTEQTDADIKTAAVKEFRSGKIPVLRQ